MRKSWLWTLGGMISRATISYSIYLWLAPPMLHEGLLYGNGCIEAIGVTVSAEIGGRVLESTLVEGRTVQEGDLLVRLDILKERYTRGEIGREEFQEKKRDLES